MERAIFMLGLGAIGGSLAGGAGVLVGATIGVLVHYLLTGWPP